MVLTLNDPVLLLRKKAVESLRAFVRHATITRAPLLASSADRAQPRPLLPPGREQKTLIRLNLPSGAFDQVIVGVLSNSQYSSEFLSNYFRSTLEYRNVPGSILSLQTHSATQAQL